MTPAWLSCHAGMLQNLHARGSASRDMAEVELSRAREVASRGGDASSVVEALERACKASAEAGFADRKVAELIANLVRGLSAPYA